ncbi:MAG: RNA polymerase sigma factor [Fimbriimonas sp.]
MNYVTDQDLAAGLVNGETWALQMLIDGYHRPLFRYLWQAGGSREDAEDLSTQALLRVRGDIKGYRGGSLRAWIFKVAYRELLRHRRRQALARLWQTTPEQHEPSTDDALVIAEALSRIPLEQRSAFLLTEAEGLSVEEASLALGIPIGTVKSRCHTARQKLRKILGPTYGETHAEPATE